MTIKNKTARLGLAVLGFVLAAGAANAQTQVFTSNDQVDTWDPIFPASEDPNWPSTVCTVQPGVGLNANWQNPHKAYQFGTNAHPWQQNGWIGFTAQWINAWNNISSQGPGGHSWTKYSTQVTGNGTFTLNLLADNCSWVYIDDQLVGFQATGDEAYYNKRLFPVTLSGTHTLQFIIFDGGGAAGGAYILQTDTTTVFPDNDSDGLTNPEETLHGTNPNNPDTDGDGVNDGDEVDAGTNPTVPDVAPTDSDNDGVYDANDEYPNSYIGPTVVIGGVDSGVTNARFNTGYTLADIVTSNTASCSASGTNHGNYVSCVAKALNALRKAGVITEAEKGALQSAAGRSSIGKK